MKTIGKRVSAAFGLAVSTAVLLKAAAYTEQHRILETSHSTFGRMESNFTRLEAELIAQEEAQEVTLAITSLDKISLTSYEEIQEVRELYENASVDAKVYIDEEQLIAAEEAYAQLEEERQEILDAAVLSGNLSDILNYTSCEVQVSGNAELDALVQEYIEKATTPDMTRAEQFEACYDYMVSNFYYASNYNYSYGISATHTVEWATAFLRDGYGTCNHWNSAFMYIARALGYDAGLVYGATASSRGGSTEHYWMVAHIEGMDYVFDPQVERDMARRSGVNTHSRYGLYGSTAGAKYYLYYVVE